MRIQFDVTRHVNPVDEAGYYLSHQREIHLRAAACNPLAQEVLAACESLTRNPQSKKRLNRLARAVFYYRVNVEN